MNEKADWFCAKRQKIILGCIRKQINEATANKYYSSSVCKNWILLTKLIWPNSSLKGWILLINRLLLHLSDNSVIWWELATVWLFCIWFIQKQYFSTREGDVKKKQRDNKFLNRALNSKECFHNLLELSKKLKSWKTLNLK